MSRVVVWRRGATLKGSDRLPVAIIGDGDYLMGVNALWTDVMEIRHAGHRGRAPPGA
ncbi:hypothetical protein L541_1156 [Bordetella hinzii CA90 BAL1384]|uniref:hypothetical protein n=1 Tax=Bordetella hinzii TaxID=103855 RepID=UPI00045AE72E|nr:hypothetical protein [Bordetella hinzii]KCB30226.1 hypothetical protein L541_1156 [Bordetella hinzii CA90 BAL1384]